MKRAYKSILFPCVLLFTVFVVFSIFSVSALADDSKSSVTSSEEIITGEKYEIIYRDEAELIEESEKPRVVEAMRKVAANANVIFYTTSTPGTSDTSLACERACASYYGTSKTDPVVMFTIDMKNRQIYMYCTGDVRHIIRNTEATIITDNIYLYAKGGRYDECAVQAFDQAHTLLNGKKIKRPMQIINNILLSLIVGFMVNFIFLKCARALNTNGNRIKSNKADVKNHLSLTEDKKCIRTYKYVYTEGDGGSGGGGYSGGSSGGGGGSSGGSSGGGHSF